AGDHVGGAGADGGGAGEGAQAVVQLGEGGSGVHHRLLVAGEVVGELALLLQRLADARDVAVAGDAPAAGEELLAAAVALDVLVDQEAHDRLGGGEPLRGCHLPAPSKPYRPPRAATNDSTSARVGIELAQAGRVTTIAPQALPIRAALCQSQPCRY